MGKRLGKRTRDGVAPQRRKQKYSVYRLLSLVRLNSLEGLENVACEELMTRVTMGFLISNIAYTKTRALQMPILTNNGDRRNRVQCRNVPLVAQTLLYKEERV